MNFGFNSNVRVAEALYHVQTEDRGPVHPYMDTVVYDAGRVVFKLSTNYEEFAAASSTDGKLEQHLHEQLALQHRNVIAKLEAGTLPLRGKENSATELVAEEPDDGIDVRLTNSKTWLASGIATLEVELRLRKSKEEVEDAEVEALLERGKERIHCFLTKTDPRGCASLKFPMPTSAADGASLVIRAKYGVHYGELRFLLKSKQSGPIPAVVSK